MPPAGSRTKSTDVWLLPVDEVRLAERINDALPDSGWICSHPGPLGLHQVHLHSSIEAAIACGGIQAFLPLPAGSSLPAEIALAADAQPRSEVPNEAIVQLLRSSTFEDDLGEHFRVGRLAVRWFEPEVGSETHALLTEQTRLIWAALRAVTRPAAIVDQKGRRSTACRIGPAARQMVIESRIPLTRGGWSRYRLAQ